MKQQDKNSDELDYEALGVAPPTVEEHGTEDDIAEKMKGQKNKHDWRQEGARLYCVACPWEHATEPRFVDYILQGTDANGLPILKKL